MFFCNLYKVHKCRLSIIILHLHNDDVVGAQNYYSYRRLDLIDWFVYNINLFFCLFSEASSTCAYGFPGNFEIISFVFFLIFFFSKNRLRRTRGCWRFVGSV